MTNEDEEAALELIRIKCATDLELYSVLFFPHYCSREFSKFHKELFRNFKFGQRDIRRVNAAPRGSAKSTFKTLIEAIHDVCYGTERFILIISNTGPLANKKLKDIRTEILGNSDLQAIYGVRFPKSKPGESEFEVIADKGRTYFAAVGKGSQVRGIRIGQHRPTKIILDDVEHSDEVHNERIRRKTEEWFFEDVGKLGDTGTNIEFVGTVLHKEALLPRLLKNPSYTGNLTKSILSWSEREDLWNEWRTLFRDLDDGQRLEKAQAFYEANKAEMLKGTDVLWPEKETYLDHMKDMEEIGKRAFMKEKQNDPMGSDETVFERFHWYREEKDGLRILETGALVEWRDLEAVGAMDPSTGKERSAQGKLGDYSVIACGYSNLVRNSNLKRLFIHHDYTKRVSPTKYIAEIFNLNERFKFSKFAVETNLYRNLLLPNILDEQRRRENEGKKLIKIPFYDVEQTENKRERITLLEPKVNHGYILFNVSLSQDFKNMFENFPHADHDDAPDCVHILWSLINNCYRAAAVSINAMSSV